MEGDKHILQEVKEGQIFKKIFLQKQIWFSICFGCKKTKETIDFKTRDKIKER